jgi:thiamine transport system substrate-binding protein
MLSARFQADMPMQMFVLPVNPQATLDATFEKYLAIAAQPAQLSPADIAANRDKWVEAWTNAVLR